MLYRFGPYELDSTQSEMRKCGLRVKLERKPLQLLIALVESAGEVVTRADLKRKLWGEDVYVDFDKGLNVAMAKLRATLNDSSEKSSYIETVTSEGYRFIARVEVAVAPVAAQAPENQAPEINVPAPATLPSRTRVFAMLGLVLFMAAGVAYLVVYIRASSIVNKTAASHGTAGGRKAMAALLYVLNQGAHSVSAVDTASYAVASTLSLKADPRGAAILPGGSEVYISLNGANSVVVLDARTGRITEEIPVGDSPVGVAASPRPPYIYVANNYSNSVSVIDARTNTVVRSLPVGGVPTEIAITFDGRRGVVTNQSSGTVTVIDTVANAVLATIPVGATPVGAAITRDCKFAWITLAGQNEVVVIDLAMNKVAHRIGVGLGPVRVAISRDGKYALVSNFFSNTVTVVDAVAMRSVGTIDVGLNPVQIALDPAGVVAYAANFGSNTVSAIDTRTMKVVETIVVGSNPVDLIMQPCYEVPCDGPRNWTSKATGNAGGKSRVSALLSEFGAKGLR